MTKQPGRDPIRVFAAGAMIAVGGLVFALCGLCTLAFSATTIASAFSSPGANAGILGWLFLYAMAGGVPALAGFLLLRSGLRRLRPPTPKADPKTFD